MVSSYQFRLSFRQVKRRAVGLRIGRNQVYEKRYGLEKNVPMQMPLRVDDVAQAEASGHNHHSDQRQAQRHFVADHLSAGAQSAEQRVLAIESSSLPRDAAHPN